MLASWEQGSRAGRRSSLPGVHVLPLLRGCVVHRNKKKTLTRTSSIWEVRARRGKFDFLKWAVQESTRSDQRWLLVDRGRMKLAHHYHAGFTKDLISASTKRRRGKKHARLKKLKGNVPVSHPESYLCSSVITIPFNIPSPTVGDHNSHRTH